MRLAKNLPREQGETCIYKIKSFGGKKIILKIIQTKLGCLANLLNTGLEIKFLFVFYLTIQS